MIITVLRSRLNPQTQEEYRRCATRMSELARAMPGYLSHKGYTAEDGERVTIVEFASQADLRAWATHPEHVAAKRQGRKSFFTEYRVQICDVLRDSADRGLGATAEPPGQG
jgi:heme-degrading monooxygenase HmoA